MGEGSEQSQAQPSAAERVVRSACSANTRRARRLLAREPALARHDLACACVCGEAAEVARVVEDSPERASAPTGPLERAPILYACFSRLGRGDRARAAAIRSVVRVLIDAGADPDARFMHGAWVQSTLYGAAGIAGDPELTAMLLAAGADPDDRGPGHSVGEALYHACEQPDPECARLLIDAGTDAETVSHCLGRALNFPNSAMVRMFCTHGARARAGHLSQAVWRRRGPEIVGLLLDAGAPVEGDLTDGGSTALQGAVRWGDGPVAEMLIARGADEQRVRAGDRALGTWLARGGETVEGCRPPRPPERSPEVERALDELLEVAIDQGDLSAVRRLLDAGASATGLRADGEEPLEFTPLGVAAWRGYAEVSAELVSRGAPTEFSGGGSAIGAALHGSRHCNDPEGGPTMATIDEIDRSRYRATVEALLAAGAQVPERLEDDRPSVTRLMADLGLPG
jgi:ankyrin repeat protein